MVAPKRFGATTDAREIEYVDHHFPRFVRELAQLVAHPTISASHDSSVAMQDCVQLLAAHLRSLGARRVRIVPGQRHPSIYGIIPGPPGARRVLIYGHYDVQPPDPLKEWETPPFSPTVRQGLLFGRGASDDKGQFFAHLKAVETVRNIYGCMPVGVAFLLEGEEEVGSPSLPRVLSALLREFPCHLAVVSDTPVIEQDRPSLTHALRGDLFLEVQVEAASRDLHSGNFGGAVVNTLEALVSALSVLHNERGQVMLDDFYADVVEVPWQERHYMRRMGPGPADVRRSSGGAALSGEAGFTSYERTTIRPTLEIAGLRGGYQGPGAKGVIPSCAIAKIDIRTVPSQRPDQIREALTRFLSSRLPLGHRLHVKELMRVAPITLDRNSPLMRVAARAYERGFGAPPAFTRLGGSIPVVSLLYEKLRIPTVLMGLALPDDGAHAPNEHFSLSMLAKGIRTSAAFLQELGTL